MSNELHVQAILLSMKAATNKLRFSFFKDSHPSGEETCQRLPFYNLSLKQNFYLCHQLLFAKFNFYVKCQTYSLYYMYPS